MTLRSSLLTWRSGVRFYQNVSMCCTVWLRKHGNPGGKKLTWNDRARNYSKENSVISTVFFSHRQSTHGICSIIQHLNCEFSPYTSLDGNHRKQNLSELLWILRNEQDVLWRSVPLPVTPFFTLPLHQGRLNTPLSTYTVRSILWPPSPAGLSVGTGTVDRGPLTFEECITHP